MRLAKILLKVITMTKITMSKPTEEMQQEAIRPTEPPAGLGQRLRDRFAEVATAEFAVPTRHTPRAPLQQELSDGT